MRLSVTIALALVCLLATGCNYFLPSNRDQIRPITRQLFGIDYQDYTFLSTPITSFGVGTVVGKGSSNESGATTASQYLVATADGLFRPGISDDAKAQAVRLIFPAGQHPRTALDQHSNRNTAFNAVAPSIASSLSAGARVDLNAGVHVTFGDAGAVRHELAWDQLLRAISDDLIDMRMARRLAEEDVEIIQGDLTSQGFTITVDVDESLNATLMAALTAEVGKELRKGSGASVHIEQRGLSSFALISDTPVIVAQRFGPTPPVFKNEIRQLLKDRELEQRKTPRSLRVILKAVKISSLPSDPKGAEWGSFLGTHFEVHALTENGKSVGWDIVGTKPLRDYVIGEVVPLGTDQVKELQVASDCQSISLSFTTSGRGVARFAATQTVQVKLSDIKNAGPVGLSGHIPGSLGDFSRLGLDVTYVIKPRY